MNLLALLTALAWISALVSFTTAWIGWKRRHLLLSESLWFVLANLSAGIWTATYGIGLQIYDASLYLHSVFVRDLAASLTALFFFATMLSAWRPRWRKSLYIWVIGSAILQTILEWITLPYREPLLFSWGNTRVWLDTLDNTTPYLLKIVGSWLPIIYFLAGLITVFLLTRPLMRRLPWWRQLPYGLFVILLAGIQIWTMLPQSPPILRAVQVLPLSMWALSLLLNSSLLRLRFGFFGSFTPEGVLSQVAEGVVVATVDGNLAWWNERAGRELALQPAERGLPIAQRLAQHPGWRAIQRAEAAAKRGIPVTFTDEHGRLRDWIVSWIPLEDANGAVLGQAFVFFDLTTERSLQRSLQLRLQIQNLLRDLFALLLEDMGLEALATRIIAQLMQPLGEAHPIQGALYLAPNPQRPTEAAWHCAAWSGSLTPPPSELPYPAEQPWSEAHFWSAWFQAGSPPVGEEAQVYVWPLREENRLWGALVLYYPHGQQLHEEVRRALETATQIITHLVRHRRNQVHLLQMQQVYESMQEAVLIHSLNGEILDCNPAAEELLGARYEELVGQPPYRLPFRMVEPDPVTLARALQKEALWHGRVRLVYPRARRERTFQANIVRVLSPYSEPRVRLVSVLHDITEEEQLQRALQQERAYLGHLVEVARMLLSAALTLEQILHYALETTITIAQAEGGSLITLDDQGRPKAVYTREGVRYEALDFAQRVLQEGAAGAAMRARQPLRVEDTTTSEYWLQDRGMSRWRSALVVPLFYQEQALGILTLTHSKPGYFTPEHERWVIGAAELVALALHNALLYDEQFRLGQELLEAKEAAETLQRRQERFFANLSHEMRTPLQAILGYVDVLRMEHPEWGTAVADLNAIEEAARELLDLVNQMLEFQRTRYKEQPLYLTEVAVPEIIASVQKVLRPLQQRQRNRLQVTITPPNLTMHTDPDKLRRILLNLLSNAFKFTSAGQVTLTISEETRAGETWVRFVVRDTGVGIPPDKLDKIFEPFEQAEPYRFGGTGLGLYLVRDFTRRLGGRVEVESQVGQGSVFTVWLPRRTSAEDTTTAS